MSEQETSLAHKRYVHVCAELERLRAINAELLAALEELIGYFPTSTTKPPVELLKQGRAAIAKAQP